MQAPSTGICKGLTGLARGRGSRSPAPRAPLYWADCSRPSPGYTLGFERGLPALGKAWPAPPATCHLLPAQCSAGPQDSWLLPARSLCRRRAGSSELPGAPLPSQPHLSWPREGGQVPLTPPVGGRLTQDLLPALGPPSPLDSSESRLHFPLRFLAQLLEPALHSSCGWDLALSGQSDLECLGGEGASGQSGEWLCPQTKCSGLYELPIPQPPWPPSPCFWPLPALLSCWHHPP